MFAGERGKKGSKEDFCEFPSCEVRYYCSVVLINFEEARGTFPVPFTMAAGGQRVTTGLAAATPGHRRPPSLSHHLSRTVAADSHLCRPIHATAPPDHSAPKAHLLKPPLKIFKSKKCLI